MGGKQGSEWKEANVAIGQHGNYHIGIRANTDIGSPEGHMAIDDTQFFGCSIKTYKTPKRIGCYRHNSTVSGLPTIIRQYSYPPYGIRQLCEEAALMGGYTVRAIISGAGYTLCVLSFYNLRIKVPKTP